ncbi:hypothetical protein MS3_00000140 [Schistosoma haematobium]|uniref:Reverse transcriptase domain-containing protein n=1 Tax=Schistosoma haematobium TaxID=6185 RepID=A0A922LLB5_SCHHA|nr:hypothetical protein MS3_00000140 [Schistosoma haematobium]KAH9588344.1 hypothetical protein MS3_00000140 [Schistosoma haematobium]CAH8563202.1 unnamed protein product [Schistosoma haematobium]
MVNNDVVALCTSIPIDKCIDFVNDLLENENTLSSRCPLSISSIMKSLKLFLNSTIFIFTGTFNKQTKGVALGSPVSPIVANLFMSPIESYIFASNNRLCICRRYVHNTFFII